jgi:hypothetical protein
LTDQFNRTGTVEKASPKERKVRWGPDVESFVRNYIDGHPCFFIEELQDELREKFPDIRCSVSTISRYLRFDLNLSRKVLQKRAREARPSDIAYYEFTLEQVYMHPEQLVFVDETSKDSRASVRHFAWSMKGAPAVVNLPFARGKRVSVLAAMDSEGFLAWRITEDTFTRKSFYEGFVEEILPHLRPWPMRNSIVLMDNARIHMFQELVDAVHTRGAHIFFLPPYCPHMNPIEFGFSNLKRWLQRHANMVFGQYPKEVLDVAFPSCSKQSLTISTFEHCGYSPGFLQKDRFRQGVKE